ncbi:hypothetical protein RhiLY_05134 [Ceratobasidium sp. AG-Ba]|nr:hypothetical protein RhiLY_05134 [Ceratobasidium sp. AG-Ba]
MFVDCGGDLSGYTKNTFEVTHLIRRSFFQYLLPGRVRVYFDDAVINGRQTTGITFKIGDDNAKLEDIPRDLLLRCFDIFTFYPDEFIQNLPNKRQYQWRRGDEVKGMVTNADFLESDRDPEDYCFN